MQLAILGASSQIAKDLVLSFAAAGQHQLDLYARQPQLVAAWLAGAGLAGRYRVDHIDAFGAQRRYDGVLNFVGVGNPAQAAAMGAAIFDVTLRYDQLALDYVRQHPSCRYLFLSSGAAYGSGFDAPAGSATPAAVGINALQPQDWYGVAKLHAECRHRAMAPLAIVDLRVFNYFSHTQDIAARFLITDVVRAIRDGQVLQTAPGHMVRDYLHPVDFHQLVEVVLGAPPMNLALDCYTRAPIDKASLLEAMQQRFGLRFACTDGPAGVNATGAKPHYYSRHFKAAEFGYQPSLSSLEGIVRETALMLGSGGARADT